MPDKQYMKRAMELAALGEGWVHPNPMVGAVIVKDGRIIGEGYHKKCGDLHAERNAFASLTESAEGADLYVTLEPCCHYGKTPPCTEAVIEHKVGRVIIGSRDPNPKVAGKGVQILREAGIEVICDFMKEECDALNPVFFHYITKKRPYVIMKYAMTLDGKIAARTGDSKWITSEKARMYVQGLRHKCMGILAGIGTVLADDPLLNCRLENGRSPVRIICDSRLRIPAESQIVRTADQYRTIVAFADSETGPGKAEPGELKAPHRRALSKAGVELWNLPDPVSGRVDLQKLMEMLGEEEIDSVLLEGGADLNESALRAGIVQEVNAFVAPKIFGGPAKGPVMGEGIDHPDEAWMFQTESVEFIGPDLLIISRIPS